VRGISTWTLVVLIISCPLFRAADESDARAHHAPATRAPASDPSAPASCPNDAGNCVCDGAVLGPTGRPLDLDSAVPPPACDGFSAPSGADPANHPALLPGRGGRLDPTARSGARGVRAWLQDFRC
jgi:hypothetical protein